MHKPASPADYAAMFAISAIIFVIVLLVFKSLTAAFVAPGIILAFVAPNISNEDDEFSTSMFVLAGMMVLVGGIGGYANWW